ncbi:MAG: PAS domain-containing protein [Vicinamibacteria bacterium]|nr:PAS domain-containing protein [Vicinamibacteria bacterium]
MIERRPLKNNLPLSAVLFVILAITSISLMVVAKRSPDIGTDFLASALLFGLSVINLTLLLVVLFVLVRNLVRAFLDSRRGVVGARLRLRLVLALLVMGMLPSLILIGVGGSLIQDSTSRWLSFDAAGVAGAARAVAVRVEEERVRAARALASSAASELSRRHLKDPKAPLASQGLGLPVDTDLLLVVNARNEVEATYGRSPLLPSEIASLAAEARAGRLAELSAKKEGEDLRLAARMVPDALGYVVIAGLVASVDQRALTENLDKRLDTFEKLRAARGPISSLYISLFLFPALLTMVGASWLPFVLARRFARPVRNVALAAERIAAGERGVRVEKDETDEEFVKLIQSFNLMSERLARSEEEVEFSRSDLTRKNLEIDERRRLMETVLETIGTGVLVVDGEQKVKRVNSAASRLLGGDPTRIVESPLSSLVPQELAGEVTRSIARVLEGRSTHFERDLALFGARGRREVRFRVAPFATPGQGPPGAVIVLEDVTPLMQAQKVAAWGEVARKLAHEIKNPLTPIKLSAQRVRKAHLKGANDFDRVLSESIDAIVSEVDALQHLVDEFAQFARLPPSRPIEGSLNAVVEAALALYETAYPQVSLERKLDPELPLLRLDGPQIKRVIINLVDNAIAALGEKGSIEIGTAFDPASRRATLTVADSGPGVPPASRETIFAPNFSTKRKGSGLGLAIARRIVEDHGGEIRVEDNEPRGARFVIELPA